MSDAEPSRRIDEADGLQHDRLLADLDQTIGDREQAIADHEQGRLDDDARDLNAGEPPHVRDPALAECVALERRQSELDLAQSRRNAHQAQLSAAQSGRDDRQTLLSAQEEAAERSPQGDPTDLPALVLAAAERAQAARRRADAARLRALSAEERALRAEQRASDLARRIP